MRISAPSSRVQMHELGVEDCDVAGDADVAGIDTPGPCFCRVMRFGPSPLHLDRDVLDVEDDVGHVLAHAGDRGEFMQHAVDMNRGDGRALQRGQQDAAQARCRASVPKPRSSGSATRVAARVVVAGRDLELVRLDQFLPVLLNHGHIFLRTARPPIDPPATPTVDATIERARIGARSDAPALARAAAIVRDRRHVADRGDGEARSLQRAQRRFAAGAGARDLDLERAHAVLRALRAASSAAICAA